MSVVLMYHAVHAGGDLSRIAPEDRPYAVDAEAFARQLDAVAARLAREPAADDGDGDGGAGGGGRRAPAVAITFDDGHASNVDIALPMLLERGLAGLFFVTADWVGAREHYVDADMLAGLVRAGMSVGAHGATHRFFDDLSGPEARSELIRSRRTLESAVGAPVRSMSFPGGRHDGAARRLAREAGLEALFDSRAATVAPEALGPALALAGHGTAPGAGHDASGSGAPGAAASGTGTAPVPRVAVRHDTCDTTFARMIDPDPAWYAAARRGERVRGLARRVLGNRIYHGLYKSLRAR